jgi:hypothetical protein
MNKAIVFSVAAVVVALILGNAYKQKFREADRIVVTGLGEQEFTSDLIVWRGWVIEQDWSLETAYAKLNANKAKVQKYIREKGIADTEVMFMFVDVNKVSDPVYNAEGNYSGSKFAGYELRQEFRVESSDVEAVENISREISSLIAQGVQMEAWQPEYYYTKLGDLKLELIERATQDARERAEKIAENSKARLKSLGSGRMGVFQITGANMDEAYDAGGTFNTSSKQKKASITMRLEYLAR